MTSHHILLYSWVEEKNETNYVEIYPCQGKRTRRRMSETLASMEDHYEPQLYEIRLKGHLDNRWANWFEDLTITLEEDGDTLRVWCEGELRAVTIQALPYPGLATDLQAPMAVLLTQARGVSYVHERVFDNRLLYVGELRKMGAEVVTTGTTTAIISGPTPLIGSSVRALDVRAGAALILAGLAASGRTEVADVYHVDRGYERIGEKLGRLGAAIQRV